MHRDVGSDDLATAPLRNLGILADELASTASLGESDDDVSLTLQDGPDFCLLGLNDERDLLLDGFAVGRQVVETDNRSGGSDGVVRQVKVGGCLGEVILRRLGSQSEFILRGMNKGDLPSRGRERS